MKTILLYLALISSNYHVDLNVEQTKCLATAIYHEARGEEIMGQASVAYVINNRIFSDRYPDTACGVVYQPYQFTDIKHARPDYNSKAWKQAVEVAAFTQVGLIDDETDGATLYYNPSKVTPRWDWSKTELVGYVGNHKFMREL